MMHKTMFHFPFFMKFYCCFLNPFHHLFLSTDIITHTWFPYHVSAHMNFMSHSRIHGFHVTNLTHGFHVTNLHAWISCHTSGELLLPKKTRKLRSHVNFLSFSFFLSFISTEHLKRIQAVI